jgi:signal transduction histidine kinase
MLKKISSRLIVSYLVVILITSLFICVIFVFFTNKYMENKVRKNLEEDMLKVEQAIKDNFNVDREDEQGRIRNSRRFRVDIGTVEDWVLIGKDLRLFYPRVGEKADKFNSKILPAIMDNTGEISSKPVKFQLEGIRYMAILNPIKLEIANGFEGWIVAYTYVGTVDALRYGVFIVLLISLLFTGCIAIVFGIFSARSIAKPIIVLRNRAEMLSQRDFDTRVNIKTGDELEELANSINKVAGELKAYDIAQKKFIQNASHELKTPLMSIQGYAEGIKDGVFDNNDKALDVIIDECSRLKSLVGDIIYLSKLETMEDYYNFSLQSMNETIEKSIEKIKSISLKKNIDMSLVLDKDVRISIDRDKFIQALLNILGNCLRYAVKEIKIKTLNEEKMYKIIISDDGEGFDKEEIKYIFERFYKGKNGNTGLGLSITKVIVEKHGGTIEAGNSSGGGAVFIIKIPL